MEEVVASRWCSGHTAPSGLVELMMLSSFWWREDDYPLYTPSDINNFFRRFLSFQAVSIDENAITMKHRLRMAVNRSLRFLRGHGIFRTLSSLFILRQVVATGFGAVVCCHFHVHKNLLLSGILSPILNKARWRWVLHW